MADLMPIIEGMEHRWMRAWVGGDRRALKALTARNFRMVVGSQPCAILDAKSWLEAAGSRYRCQSYRFGAIYGRVFGTMSLFASRLEMKASIDGLDWSGEFWLTDLWRKSAIRGVWRLEDRMLSRPEDSPGVADAIRSLQLWR